jgi:tripartite-type tricarboxylate transporter receptor subunit TctC
MRKTMTIFASAALMVLGGFAKAQDWPTRPVTMVVPFAAGGPVDTFGRVVAPRLSEILRQQVIIENIGGAGGMNGSARVAKAAPDGYQFLLGNSATHGFNQILYKKPLYDAVTDFAPVAVVYGTSKVLVTRKDFPANTLAEFIAYAKANQSRLQYGSAGAGSATHITCVLFNAVIGVDVTHVPYRGAGPALQDLMGGRLDYMCDIISTALAQIEGGTIKPIAMLTLRRSAVLPNLATGHEQGLTDFDADSWGAFFLPKGTPAAIVRCLAKAASETLDTLAVRERLVGLGLSVPPPEQRTPDYLAKLVPADIEKWAGPIKASGARAD